MDTLTYQATGDANNTDGSLRRLGDIKQIIEQCLIFVLGKQVKLFQHKQDWFAALVA